MRGGRGEGGERLSATGGSSKGQGEVSGLTSVPGGKLVRERGGGGKGGGG